MKIYALLIGVNRYDAGIGALKCAAKDARKLESLFDHRCRFQTRYLEQEDLHSGVVEQAIEQAGKELAGGGVFVFYFSGHGKQQGDDQIMLLPGAKRDLLEKGLTRHSGVFSYQTLRAMTSGWKGVRRLFIFDACRAMLPTKSGDMQPAFEGIGIRRDPGMANKTAWEAEHDFTELNSCGPGQASLELPEDKGGPGHGVFTLALLESLNTAFDDQCPVCVDERFVADLRTRMTAIAERHGERLCGEPTLYGEPVTLWEGLGGKTDDVRDQREEQRGQQIQGLIADFERQLGLGNLERPVTDNCRDTLNRLSGLDYSREELQYLSLRLEEALKDQVRQDCELRDEQRIAAARLAGTMEAYAQYLATCEECAHREEANQSIRSLKEGVESETVKADHLLWFEVSGDLGRLEAASGKWRTEEYRNKAKKEQTALRKQAEQEAAAEEKKKQEEVVRQAAEVKLQSEKDLVQQPEHRKTGWSRWVTGLEITSGACVFWVALINWGVLPPYNLEKIPILVALLPPSWLVVPRTNFSDPTTGMEFVYVKGGCYPMGNSFENADENEPVHEVCVSDYWLGKYEVTQGEWEKVMGNNPSNFKKGQRYPVEQVSWNDTQEFIKKLNSRSGWKYRLPTEAEWEYAARNGGKQVRFGTGKDTIGPDEANIYAGENYKKLYSRSGISRESTMAVGSFSPNGLGLYDMSGNVYEWCQDRFASDYYANSPQNNPVGPSSGTYRVIRGGSWGGEPLYAQAAYHHGHMADRNGGGSLGFRLALPPDQPSHGGR